MMAEAGKAGGSGEVTVVTEEGVTMLTDQVFRRGRGTMATAAIGGKVIEDEEVVGVHDSTVGIPLGQTTIGQLEEGERRDTRAPGIGIGISLLTLVVSLRPGKTSMAREMDGEHFRPHRQLAAHLIYRLSGPAAPQWARAANQDEEFPSHVARGMPHAQSGGRTGSRPPPHL